MVSQKSFHGLSAVNLILLAFTYNLDNNLDLGLKRFYLPIQRNDMLH